METEFGPSVYDCPRHAFFKLTQDWSVAQYYNNFTALANWIEGVSLEALLDCFISGLKWDLQREMTPWRPKSITKAVSLSKLFEEKYVNVGRNSSARSYYVTDTHVPIKPMPKGPPPLLLPAHITSASQPTFKKINFHEMELPRAKGLCFNCEE